MADSESNPYAPPSARSVTEAIDSDPRDLRRMLQRFRSEIHALGVLWIIIGLLRALFFLNRQVAPGTGILGTQPLAELVSLSAVALVPLGIATLLKKLVAVRIGGGLFFVCFLATFGISRFGFAELLIAGIFGFFVCAQAIRVYRTGLQLQAAGIRLTAHPSDLPYEWPEDADQPPSESGPRFP